MNIDIFNYDNDVVLKVNYRAKAISTTFNGGNIRCISTVIHHHVNDSFDLKSEFNKLSSILELNINKSIVFMTAADIKRRHIIYDCKRCGIHTIVSLTAGFTNPYIISNGEIFSLLDHGLSTINIAVFVDRRLNSGAIVDAIRVVSEVKSASLYSFTGGMIHGTTSDAIAIISNVSGREESFAGPITPVGKSMAMAVFEALSHARL
ncbi:MAG: adenosylcobinamide amidohydrolase [Conexivisphaerales archaeon]